MVDKRKSRLKETARRVLHSGLPVPSFARPVIRWVFGAVGLMVSLWRLACQWFVVGPVVRSLATVGPGLRIERIPDIGGKGRIVIGSNVWISGKIGISLLGHVGLDPEFRVGNRTFIGHQCGFSVARRIIIGDDCLIAAGVKIRDNDGHPLDPDLRRARKPISPEDVSPVTIEDGVWIGAQSTILKGITIGRNAVVGTASVVTRDVPANMVVAGNPARVIRSLGAAAGVAGAAGIES